MAKIFKFSLYGDKGCTHSCGRHQSAVSVRQQGETVDKHVVAEAVGMHVVGVGEEGDSDLLVTVTCDDEPLVGSHQLQER